jgi:hypothetical protein
MAQYFNKKCRFFTKCFLNKKNIKKNYMVPCTEVCQNSPVASHFIPDIIMLSKNGVKLRLINKDTNSIFSGGMTSPSSFMLKIICHCSFMNHHCRSFSLLCQPLTRSFENVNKNKLSKSVTYEVSPEKTNFHPFTLLKISP